MASKDHSFDIVSQVDLMEVSNAVEQAKKEIATRYDFKDSKSSIQWDRQEKKIEIHTENDFRLKSVMDIIQSKFVKRRVSLKCMDIKPSEKATGNSVRQVIEILQGIPSEKAKEISKFIRDSKIKVQAQIQGDQVRVQSPKIDNLQETMGLLKQKAFGVDLQFINYR